MPADARTVLKLFSPILVKEIITVFSLELVIIGSSSLLLALAEAHLHHSTPNCSDHKHSDHLNCLLISWSTDRDDRWSTLAFSLISAGCLTSSNQGHTEKNTSHVCIGSPFQMKCRWNDRPPGCWNAPWKAQEFLFNVVVINTNGNDMANHYQLTRSSLEPLTSFTNGYRN